MSKKRIATSFLKEVSSGNIDEAYNMYIHRDFIHHNPYFKGERESLRQGMKENQEEFPDKRYEVIQVVEENDRIVVRGKVKLNSENTFALFYLFRFADGKIIEAWEASQQEMADSPNGNGLF